MNYEHDVYIMSVFFSTFSNNWLYFTAPPSPPPLGWCWTPCLDQYESSRYTPQPRISNSLPVSPGGRNSGLASSRDSSSLPLYYSSYGRSTPQTLTLNPTTLAMLQQHNYIPYFRGTQLRLVFSLKPTNVTPCMETFGSALTTEH